MPKNYLKKFLCLILSCCMMLSLSSCGTNDTSINDVKSSISSSKDDSIADNEGGITKTNKFGSKDHSSTDTKDTENSKDTDNTDKSEDIDENQETKDLSVSYSDKEKYNDSENSLYETEENADENNDNSSYNAEIDDKIDNAKHLCTITIDCTNALNSDKLKSSMRKVLPSDGIIYSNSYEFSDGDSVFDVLYAVTKNHGIPMEFSSSAVYGSKYIEGINSLYEFDCGELSGWKYSVNGTVPNYGCDQYKINNNDKIIFYYVTKWGEWLWKTSFQDFTL